MLSASSYGHFSSAKEFRSQCHIFRCGNIQCCEIGGKMIRLGPKCRLPVDLGTPGPPPGPPPGQPPGFGRKVPLSQTYVRLPPVGGNKKTLTRSTARRGSADKDIENPALLIPLRWGGCLQSGIKKKEGLRRLAELRSEARRLNYS